MSITLIGTGCGHLSTITAGAVRELRRADLIVGAPRLLASLPEEWGSRRAAAILAEDILRICLEYLRGEGGEEGRICVVYSGDTGFYSGARTLLPLLGEADLPAGVMPGISSVQMLAARLQLPWQDWKLVSAHGLECDGAAETDPVRPTFFLTGGKLGPGELCGQLTEGGLGERQVVIAARLSYEDEKIFAGPARQFAGKEFDSLSVMLVKGEEAAQKEDQEEAPAMEDMEPGRFRETAGKSRNRVWAPGIPDDQFIRGEVPMTKQDIRAVIAGRMQVQEGDVIWDVGAGTGSVSVELAIQAGRGRVYAVERDADGSRLIRLNRDKFGCENLEPVDGAAPDALRDLPAPDRVFIGGSGGKMEEILRIILEKNEHARICVSAILLETAVRTLEVMAGEGLQTSVVQVAVATGRPAGGKHMMMGGNPIFIITGEKPCSE